MCVGVEGVRETARDGVGVTTTGDGGGVGLLLMWVEEGREGTERESYREREEEIDERLSERERGNGERDERD